MTIADNYEPIKQETNGVTTQFSFDFYALNDDYIKVLLEVDGEQSVIDPTEYEVTFSSNGGLVTFYDPPAGNAYIIITRDTPREQETPFATSSGFPAKTVEGRFDKLTAMVQELQDNVDRSAKVPVGNDVDISLPVPDDGKALVWNGESLVNSDETLQSIADKATVAYSYAQEAKGYRDQASASATLAEEWAIKTDAPVEDSEYSAKYHAQASASSAVESAASATAAQEAALSITNGYDLLDHKWSDHLLNDQNWLRADTFSWQDGTVYSEAYDHLVNDVGYVRYMIPDDDLQIKFYRAPAEDTEMYAWTNQFSTLYTVSEFPQNGDDFYYHNQVFGTVLSTGIELGSDAVTPTTETIGSYTITYYPCTDGHKVVLANQESTVLNIYNESGVAWYYILDLVNHRFKLPRELPITDKSKGNGMTIGLTNGTNNYTLACGTGQYAFNGLDSTKYGSPVADSGASNSLLSYSNYLVGITPDQTKSGIISHRANENGQQYLYFYVGQFTQTATEQTAGLNSELFNGKADVDLSNAAPNASATAKETIVGWGMPDYDSGVTTGYNTDYTPPCDGLGVWAFRGNYSKIQIKKGNIKIAESTPDVNTQNSETSIILPLNGGETYTISFVNTISEVILNNFYPYKGVQNA